MTEDWWGSRLGVVPANRCLGCGILLDVVMAFTNTSEADVRVGDLTICATCFSIGVVQDNGSLRLATVEECAVVPHWVRERIALAYRQSGHKPA